MKVSKSTTKTSPAYSAVRQDQDEPSVVETKSHRNERWWNARPKIVLVMVGLAFALSALHFIYFVGIGQSNASTEASDEIHVLMPWKSRPGKFNMGESASSDSNSNDEKEAARSSSDDKKGDASSSSSDDGGWFSNWEWPWESSSSDSSDSGSESSSSDSISSDSSSSDSRPNDSSSSDSGSSDSSSTDSSDETPTNASINVETKD